MRPIHLVCVKELPYASVPSGLWALDSTAVAFSLNTPLVFRDSDVYVFEVETGTLENLTQDDPSGTGADELAMGDDGAEVSVDLYPA